MRRRRRRAEAEAARREHVARRDERREELRRTLDIDVTDGRTLSSRQRMLVSRWRVWADAARRVE